MRKKFVAVAVAITLFFGMTVRVEAGTSMDNGAASKQAVLNTNDGRFYRNASGKVVVGKAVSLGLGGQHSGAVTEDGSLYMWGGATEYGQLGNGKAVYGATKEPVKVLKGVWNVSLGRYHSGAVKKDGSLYMLGNNESGQLGDGTYENRSTPVKVLENIQTVKVGGDISGAMTKD